MAKLVKKKLYKINDFEDDIKRTNKEPFDDYTDYSHNDLLKAELKGRKDKEKELIEQLRCNSKYKLGYCHALEEVKNIIKDEIINEEESIKRKAVRDWDILKELRFVLLKIKKLRSEK